MRKDRLRGIAIIHEDRDIIVIDKPPGLLTMATEDGRDETAYRVITDYVRKGCAKSRNRVFIVHRLDRDTSGLVIFAKHERAKRALQEGWGGTEKKYLAVAHGALRQKTGTISSYLAENAAHVVYATKDKTRGKLATTAYRVLAERGPMSLLEIDLITGRKNQIRVHLADIGHPVVGDRKYGREGDTHKRLALHAWSIAFTHPHTNQRLRFETPVPPYFTNLVR